MERFRFGEQAGPNGNKITFNGWLSIFEHDPGRLHIETAGPNGGVRSGLIIDKATAGKLGAALMKWAMPNNNAIRVHLAAVLAAYEAVTEANKCK